jgi:hypothetical protein
VNCGSSAAKSSSAFGLLIATMNSSTITRHTVFPTVPDGSNVAHLARHARRRLVNPIQAR